MKTLTIRNIIRWCLAFLCFGLVGIKISNAQIMGTGGCNFGYASAISSAFYTLSLGAENANGMLFENVAGTNYGYWGYHNNYLTNALGISNTFNALNPYTPPAQWWIDPVSGTQVSLSDSANASDSLQWGIYDYSATTPAPSGFTYTIDSVSITGHAIGGGTLSFDLLIDGTPIVNGASLGSSFSGITPSIYSPTSIIELRPYDNGTNVTEFQIDTFNVGITGTDGTNYYDLCTGAITPVPETSSVLLSALGVAGVALRRRRA